ncbi:MAG: hypothetical protein RLZZ628_4072 [Bacteroidota bacterium]|jgi:tRNA uridine 5-carbamoylmethylation protein Kti12
METKDIVIGGGFLAIMGVGIALLLSKNKSGASNPNGDGGASTDYCSERNSEETDAECEGYLKYILNKWESEYTKTKWEESKFAICKDNYPNLNIKTMTYEQAMPLIRNDYFYKYNIDKVNCEIRFMVLDAAINQGQPTAIRMLQKCAGVRVDGVCGPKTQSASMNVTMEQYKAARLAQYKDTTEERKQLYLDGWINRLNDITAQQIKINNQ